MPKGDKNSATYDKVAEFFENKGKKEWAKAKNNPDEGFRFGKAREAFKKADDIRKVKEKRFGK